MQKIGVLFLACFIISLATRQFSIFKDFNEGKNN